MITKHDAMTARYFHGPAMNNPNKIITVRATGQCQTWKTRPAEFKLPVKYGLYDSGYITHENAARWSVGPAPRA